MFAKPIHPNAVYWHKATVVRWIDGDTVVIDLDRAFNIVRKKARIRMAFINCPERFTDEGKKATEFVNLICPAGSDVLMYSHKDKTGRYGRIVGEIVCQGVNVNRAILDAHHAVLAN